MAQEQRAADICDVPHGDRPLAAPRVGDPDEKHTSDKERHPSIPAARRQPCTCNVVLDERLMQWHLAGSIAVERDRSL